MVAWAIHGGSRLIYTAFPGSQTDVDGFLAECMWTQGTPASGAGAVPIPSAGDGDEENAAEEEARIKIAWRYEQMKQFQTTVPTSNQYVVSSLCVRRVSNE